MKVVVLESGNMAETLVQQWQQKASRHELRRAALSPEEEQEQVNQWTSDQVDKQLDDAEVVIFAMLGQDMPAFVEEHAAHLQDRWVFNLDDGDWYSHVFCRYHLRWVRGLNDARAIQQFLDDLEHTKVSVLQQEPTETSTETLPTVIVEQSEPAEAAAATTEKTMSRQRWKQRGSQLSCLFPRSNRSTGSKKKC